MGDLQVGKTTFLESYITDYQNDKTIESTLILDMKSVDINNNNILYKVLFYDFSGLHQSRQSNTCHFKDIDGIIIMFDISNNKSMENLESWIDYANETISKYDNNNKEKVPYIIVCNKSDQITDNIDTMCNILTFFKERKLDFILCSSIKKTKYDSKKVIDSLIDKIISFQQSIIELDNITISEKEPKCDNCVCTSQ